MASLLAAVEITPEISSREGAYTIHDAFCFDGREAMETQCSVLRSQNTRLMKAFHTIHEIRVPALLARFSRLLHAWVVEQHGRLMGYATATEEFSGPPLQRAGVTEILFVKFYFLMNCIKYHIQLAALLMKSLLKRFLSTILISSIKKYGYH